MALEQNFECPRTLSRLRSGPLGKFLEGFCNWLLEHGFSRWTIRMHLGNVSHLNEHLDGLSRQVLESLAQEMLRAFSRPTLCDAGTEDHWKNTCVESATR